jgi:hypothetical protein
VLLLEPRFPERIRGWLTQPNGRWRSLLLCHRRALVVRWLRQRLRLG